MDLTVSWERGYNGIQKVQGRAQVQEAPAAQNKASDLILGAEKHWQQRSNADCKPASTVTRQLHLEYPHPIFQILQSPTQKSLMHWCHPENSRLFLPFIIPKTLQHLCQDVWDVCTFFSIT